VSAVKDIAHAMSVGRPVQSSPRQLRIDLTLVGLWWHRGWHRALPPAPRAAMLHTRILYMSGATIRRLITTVSRRG